MQVLKKWLIGNNSNIMQKSAVWNLVSSVEYSLQSAILLLIITRINGLFDAGVFTIAYTTTQMMATIGSYGMRSFQVSDVKNEYSFQTYFTSRLVSVIAMIAICMSYAYLNGYNREKMVIALILCIYRVVDGMEDVFHGEMQKMQRLDIASKILAIRIFAATLMFGIGYLFTKNLVVASVCMTLTAIVVSFVLNLSVTGHFEHISLQIQKEKVLKLLVVCLPICLSGFLYNYLVNAPKYAIDRNLSEEIQTIFSILFMPIFAINMLSSFIFKPMIARMSIVWNDHKIKEFTKMVLKQLLIIFGLTVCIMVACVIIGIDILGWMYHVDLDSYRFLFGLLMLFGGFAAIVAFMVVVLTIMRKQNYIIVAYGISLVIDLLLIDSFVIKYEISGAGMMYGAAMGMVMLILSIVFVCTVYRERLKDVKCNKENLS